jgi:hypothetical protein
MKNLSQKNGKRQMLYIKEAKQEVELGNTRLSFLHLGMLDIGI